MGQKLFITGLFSIFIMVVGPTLALAATISTATVKLPTAIHFLTPAGEDIEVGPGVYQVEAAESWLKLIPEGRGRSEAVLLEATSGTHEETVTEPMVRLEGEPDNPDVFHLGILLQDGTGLEAIGTISGIRPRGFNLAFVSTFKQSSRRFSQRPRVKQKSSPTVASQPGSSSSQPRMQAQVSKSTSEVDCGPYIKQISGGGDGGHSPTIAVFRNKLHVVYPRKSRGTPLSLWQWEFVKGENRWGVPRASNSLGQRSSEAQVALAVFQDRLHMVHIGKSSHNLYHSYFDGKEWSREFQIYGQKSKAAPALAVYQGELHMLHLGDSSNDLWHSVYRGKGWTINQKIGIRSEHTPALAARGKLLNMVTTHVGPVNGPKHMYLTWYNGKVWGKPERIPDQLSKTTPALESTTRGGIARLNELHLIHLGKSSNNLWYSLHGYRRITPNKSKLMWLREEKLLGLSSNSPPSVVFHEGCMHMAFQKGKSIMHATFPPRVP